MARNNVIDRAVALRQLAHWKSKEPSIAFQNRLKAPRKILDLVEKYGDSTSIKQESRRMFCVSACAAFESFWRDTIRNIVNDYRPNLAGAKQSNKITFNLADLSQILGNKLTIGDLYALSHTFQSPNAVNQALTECLGFDAFGKFRTTNFAITEVLKKGSKKEPFKDTIKGEVFLRVIPDIERCFVIRHETVHHIGSTLRLKQGVAVQFASSMWQFNTFMEMFLYTWLEREKKKKHPISRKSK